MENLTNAVVEFIDSLDGWGPILSCFIVILESIIPVLPLCVFVSLIFLAFGPVFGLLISVICTDLGCTLSFCLCRYVFRDKFEKRFRTNEKVNKLMNRFDNIKFSNLVLILAIPFTPASLMNVAAGLSKITFKKFLTSVLIGKIFMVFFWGFVGTTLIESIKHPIKLVYTAIIVAVAYFLSKIISKKFNID